MILLLALLQQADFGPLQRLENYAMDFRARQGRIAEPRLELVFLGLDHGAYGDVLFPEDYAAAPVLKELDRSFPWSRAVWAALAEKLLDAGARVVAFDLLFTGPSEGDDALRAVIDRYPGRIVLASAFSEVHDAQRNSLVYNGPTEALLGPGGGGGRVGFVNFWHDPDNVIRQTRLRLEDPALPGGEGGVHESFAAVVLKMAGAADRIPSTTAPLRFRFAGAPGVAYPYRPFHEVLVPSQWSRNFRDGEFFRDKTVVVGPAANVFQDEKATPMAIPERTMHGPEVHLQVIGAALQGAWLRQTPRSLDWVWTLACGGGVWWGMTRFKGLWSRLAVLTVCLVAYSGAAQLLFDRADLIIPWAAPSLAFLLGGGSVLGQDFALERWERRRLRRTLERYVSKDIVREILDNRSSYFHSLEGVRKPVAVLFSDIRGFATLTEAADSTLLVRQLNEYFDSMVPVVFATHGTLDKFIGDAVMAHWGSIVSEGNRHDVVNAVEAALGMQSGLAALNERWKAKGFPELSIGIGINHGEVIVGNLGSHQKMELTVIGDGVNLASRLEGLTKEYGLSLLLGEDAARWVREDFLLRTIDRVRVKGKTRPVTVFTVISARPPQGESPPWLVAHEEGIRCYWRREFAAAEGAFLRADAGRPNDPVIRMFLQRVRECLVTPPGEDWDGVTQMTRK